MGCVQPAGHRFITPGLVYFFIFSFRQDLLKWNGWGYKDSKFIVENKMISFTGNRYVISLYIIWNKWICFLMERACLCVLKLTRILNSCHVCY
jgi:hypothetical protein